MNKGVFYKLIHEMEAPVIAFKKVSDNEMRLWAGEKQYTYQGSGEENDIRSLLAEIKAEVERGKREV